MKKVIIFCFLYSISFTLYAQTNRNYEILTAKASLFHLQKNYEKAIEHYEQAFAIQKPNALTAYKAAGVYALGNNLDKAFNYLHLFLDSGWTEVDWLVSDPYFDALKKTSAQKWKQVEEKAFEKEDNYAKTLQFASLRKEINLMVLKDQQLRFKRTHVNNDSVLAIIDAEIIKSDLDNLNRAKMIIKEYGWPKTSQIGKDGQNNLWLIVQHADQDVEFQKTVLSVMEKLKGTAALNMENYAFLYDRVQCNLNYMQLYGTQVLWTSKGEASGFRPIVSEYQVDERRKEIGLQPLAIYSLTYGFQYKKMTKEESKQRDITYRKKVQDIVRRAKLSYENKAFQQAYDDYNEASTFLGGMSNDDNFEAAIIFSKIANQDSDEKYKSIALDFLSLLNIRDALPRTKMLNEPTFEVLTKETRWNVLIDRK